jgi:tetratricopeptide (TPR) repeat protein
MRSEIMLARLARTKYAVLLLLALAALLAYANSFTVPFQFDDDGYVVNNPIIRTFHYFFVPSDITALDRLSPTGFPVGLRYAFMTRILGYLSLAANYRLHGLSVVGYHVVNLALHVMNGWLVYLVLLATLKTGAPTRSEDGVGDNSLPREAIAVVSALLFVVHPIQTHAVTYVTSRFVLQASFFSLLSLLLYVKSRVAAGGPARCALHAAALASAAAAMLTKEFTFTLPVVVALYDLTFLAGTIRARVKRLLPISATLFIIPALVFLQQGKLHALDSTMRTITAADVSGISRLDYLLTQFRVIATYLRLLLLPVNQNIDYDFPVYHSLSAPPVLLSFLLLAALAATAVSLYRSAAGREDAPELRLAAFGILWFFITLSVESSILPLGELAAEYRLYLPSVGMITAFVSALAFAARRLAGRSRLPFGVFTCFFAAAAVLLAVATHARNTVWKDEISLWEDAARKSPAKLRPHENLGTYYSMRGRLEEARREFATALRLDPNNFELHNNLGIVYKRMGDFDRAIQEYTVAARLMPGDPMAHYNLGNVFLAQGRNGEAIREYQECVKLIPDYDEAHNNLGIAYEKMGRPNEAIAEFTKALDLNPQNVNARNNLQNSLGTSAPLQH